MTHLGHVDQIRKYISFCRILIKQFQPDLKKERNKNSELGRGSRNASFRFCVIEKLRVICVRYIRVCRVSNFIANCKTLKNTRKTQ